MQYIKDKGKNQMLRNNWKEDKGKLSNQRYAELCIFHDTDEITLFKKRN